MLIIKRKKGEDINKMLKRYKSKVKRTSLIEEIKGRKSYTKKSVKRRTMMNKGKYIQSILSSIEQFYIGSTIYRVCIIIGVRHVIEVENFKMKYKIL